MKSTPPRRAPKSTKAPDTSAAKRKAVRQEKPSTKKGKPAWPSPAQVWKRLTLSVAKVRDLNRPAATKAFAGQPAALNRNTRIGDVVASPRGQRDLAAVLERTFGVRLDTGELHQANTLDGLATLIRSKLPRPLRPLGAPK